MVVNRLRQEISEFLKFSPSDYNPSYEIQAVVAERDYDRIRITYRNDENDSIPAFLPLPHGAGQFPAVLVHHQHNGERHLGKSEVHRAPKNVVSVGH